MPCPYGDYRRGYQFRFEEVIPCWQLLGGGFFAEAAHALLELFAQRGRGVGVEGDEIPERLGAIAAQGRKCGSITIRMSRDIFADRGIGMMREAAESFRGDFGMLADEAQQVEVF